MSALIGVIIGAIIGYCTGVVCVVRLYNGKIKDGIIIMVDDEPYIANRCAVETRKQKSKEDEHD